MMGKTALVTKLAGVVAATLSAASALAAVTITKVAEYDIDNLGCGGIVYLGGNNYYLLQDHDDSTKKATLYPATIQVDPSTGKITNNLKSDIATVGIALTGNGDSKPGGDRPRQSLLRDPLFAENMKTRG